MRTLSDTLPCLSGRAAASEDRGADGRRLDHFQALTGVEAIVPGRTRRARKRIVLQFDRWRWRTPRRTGSHQPAAGSPDHPAEQPPAAGGDALLETAGGEDAGR